MLTRRHLRIKVFQALYAMQYDEERGVGLAEKQLRKSIDDIYRLYLFDLAAMVMIYRFAKERMELNRQKKLPTEEDLNPKLNFVNNRFLVWLSSNLTFQKAIQDHVISFGDEKEILRSIFKSLLEDERYQEYLELENPDLQEDRKFVKYLYGAFLVENETLHEHYEELNMYWSDDLDAAQAMATKTITAFDEKKDEQSPLIRLIKNSDDLDFAVKLFKETLRKGKDFEKDILAKAEHWEGDRIANVDSLLMKMALAELVSFNQIPVKVTLNEYIDLAKQYSTNRSGQFVNGILDKLQIEWQKEGKFKKIGRGLL